MSDPQRIEDDLDVKLDPPARRSLLARAKALLVSEQQTRSDELDDVILDGAPAATTTTVRVAASNDLEAKLRPLAEQGQLEAWLAAERSAPLFEQYERQAQRAITRMSLGAMLGMVAFILACWTLRVPYLDALDQALHHQEPGVRAFAGGQLAQLASVTATLLFPLLALLGLLRAGAWLLGALRPARALASVCALLGLGLGSGCVLGGQALLGCVLALSGVLCGELIERWWRGGR